MYNNGEDIDNRTPSQTYLRLTADPVPEVTGARGVVEPRMGRTLRGTVVPGVVPEGGGGVVDDDTGRAKTAVDKPAAAITTEAP